MKSMSNQSDSNLKGTIIQEIYLNLFNYIKFSCINKCQLMVSKIRPGRFKNLSGLETS